MRYFLINGFWSSSLYVGAPGAELVERALPVKDPRVLVVNPKGGQEVFVASWEGGVYRSQDGAQSWEDLGLRRVQVRSMAVDFEARRVYAASSNLIFDQGLYIRSF